MAEHPGKRTNPALDIVNQEKAIESARRIGHGGNIVQRVLAAVKADIRKNQAKAAGYGSQPTEEGAKVIGERRRIRIEA